MIGIDEVGRGCWAGPLLVVAARPFGTMPTSIKDSKKLSAPQREKLLPVLKACCSVGYGWVEPAEIDKHGLADAMRIGVARALSDIDAQPDEAIIMDGNVNYCSLHFKHVHCEPRADDRYPAVSAASIIAKVSRDQLMREQAQSYPAYGFERHVGYGTPQHSAALRTKGVTPLHRLSFKPVKQYLTASD